MNGANPIDRNIVKSIGSGSLSASEISRKTHVSRTTISYHLKGLLSRKMISKSAIVGRKILYSVNKKAINEARESRLVEVFTSQDMIHAYRYFFEAPKNTPIYSIQGHDAIYKISKILPPDFIKKAHVTQKRRSIIIRGFAPKSVLPILKSLDKDLIQSHIGRTVGLKLVDNGVLMGDCEILCRKTIFLISDTTKKRALILKDKSITKFLYEIMAMFYDNYDNAKIIRLNDFLKSEER